MKDDYEKQYHLMEYDHPWFVARRDFIVNYVSRNISTKSRILDIGCSGGILIQELIMLGYGNSCGIDSSPEAVDLCISKGLKNVKLMDGANLHSIGSFDVIIASDVLEHIEDDTEAVRHWKLNLNDGGVIICFVPAYGFLWSVHDEQNQHFRRYTKTKLEGLFSEAGLKVIRSSYWNASFLLPTILAILSEKLGFSNLFSKKDFYTNNDRLNYLAQSILMSENKIIQLLNLPFGVSTFVIAQSN